MPESIRRAEYSSPKVLIVQGHPRSDSFCAALAAAYRDGLGDRGVACELIAPADMNFDREVTHKGQDTRHDPGIGPGEPQHQQAALSGLASHL